MSRPNCPRGLFDGPDEGSPEPSAVRVPVVGGFDLFAVIAAMDAELAARLPDPPVAVDDGRE